MSQGGRIITGLQNDIVPAFGRGMSREVVSYLIPEIEPVLIFILVFEQGCHWEDRDSQWAVVAWQKGFLGRSRGLRRDVAVA